MGTQKVMTADSATLSHLIAWILWQHKIKWHCMWNKNLICICLVNCNEDQLKNVSAKAGRIIFTYGSNKQWVAMISWHLRLKPSAHDDILHNLAASSIFTPSHCVTNKHNETFAEEKQKRWVIFRKSFIFNLTFSHTSKMFHFLPVPAEMNLNYLKNAMEIDACDFSH